MERWVLLILLILAGCTPAAIPSSDTSPDIPLPPSLPPLEQHSCSPASRNVDACIALYDPVCGWFSEDIKCVKYPCAATYSNSCLACSDEQVAYWTPGECPA